MIDGLDPLGSLASNSAPDADFTMYIIRVRSGGLAVGGIGFFGCPDGHGRVEFGYGLVPSARGQGLASEAVEGALDHAARKGARVAVAEAETGNIASQRVLTKAGFTDVDRKGSLIRYELTLPVR